MTAELGDLPWPDVPDRVAVLVPLGSTEQHGPHLPLLTDTIVAGAVARAVAPRLQDVLGMPVVVAPDLPYGASGEHQAFPGTASIGHEALAAVLVELVRSLATWAARIVIVNGHGGNARTVAAVVARMRDEGHAIAAVHCDLEDARDAHAGHDETSLLLHLRPGLVDAGRAVPGSPEPLDAILPAMVAHGVGAVSPSGVLGDPTTASADYGTMAFRRLVDRVVADLTREATDG